MDAHHHSSQLQIRFTEMSIAALIIQQQKQDCDFHYSKTNMQIDGECINSRHCVEE